MCRFPVAHVSLNQRHLAWVCLRLFDGVSHPCLHWVFNFAFFLDDFNVVNFFVRQSTANVDAVAAFVVTLQTHTWDDLYDLDALVSQVYHVVPLHSIGFDDIITLSDSVTC